MKLRNSPKLKGYSVRQRTAGPNIVKFFFSLF